MIRQSRHRVGTLFLHVPRTSARRRTRRSQRLFSLGGASNNLTNRQLPFPGRTTAVVSNKFSHSATVAPVTLNQKTPGRARTHPQQSSRKRSRSSYHGRRRIDAAELKRLQRENWTPGRLASVSASRARVPRRKCPRPQRCPRAAPFALQQFDPDLCRHQKQLGTGLGWELFSSSRRRRVWLSHSLVPRKKTYAR